MVDISLIDLLLPCYADDLPFPTPRVCSCVLARGREIVTWYVGKLRRNYATRHETDVGFRFRSRCAVSSFSVTFRFTFQIFRAHVNVCLLNLLKPIDIQRCMREGVDIATALQNLRGHHDSNMKPATLVALVCILQCERSESFMVSDGAARGACSFKRKRGRHHLKEQHQQRVSRRNGPSLMQAPGEGVEWEVGGRSGVCTVAESRASCNAPVCVPVVILDTKLTAVSSSRRTDLHIISENVRSRMISN